MEYSRQVMMTIGGSRGGAPDTRPHKGSNSFVLTYKFYEM